APLPCWPRRRGWPARYGASAASPDGPARRGAPLPPRKLEPLVAGGAGGRARFEGRLKGSAVAGGGRPGEALRRLDHGLPDTVELRPVGPDRRPRAVIVAVAAGREEFELPLADGKQRFGILLHRTRVAAVSHHRRDGAHRLQFLAHQAAALGA